MKETVLSSPSSNDLMPAKPFNPIWEGMKKGAIVALIIAALYALAVPVLFATMNQSLPLSAPSDNGQPATAEVVPLANRIGSVLRSTGFALLVGGIPALILGAIGGGIIGAVFRYGVKHRVSTARALLYGFCMSLGIVSIRLVMLIQSEGALDGTTLADPLFWVMVMGPMIGAFLGFWWVAYQVNTKMPNAV